MTQRLNEKLIKKVINLRKMGLSYKKIANKLEISSATSHKYAKRTGISLNGKERIEKNNKKRIENFVKRFAKEKEIQEIKINKKTVRIISHCLFDGSVCTNNIGDYRISYTNSSKKEVNQFVKDFEESFGIQVNDIKKMKGKNIDWYEIYFCSKQAFMELHKYIPNYSTSSKKCELRPWIFELPRQLKIEFLRAFWLDEGCVSADGKIHGKSKSKKVIEQIVKLHESLGIECSIWKDNTSKNFAIYIHKKNENIQKFSKIGFGSGIVTRGKYLGERKQKVFSDIF